MSGVSPGTPAPSGPKELATWFDLDSKPHQRLIEIAKSGKQLSSRAAALQRFSVANDDDAFLVVMAPCRRCARVDWKVNEIGNRAQAPAGPVGAPDQGPVAVRGQVALICAPGERGAEKWLRSWT